MNSEHQNAEQTTAEVLAKEWDIIVLPGFSRQEIIEKLALKMATVIEQGPEAFFRLMYRLDIPEKKLVEAMHDKNAVMEIATLVYERQLQKARSREYYRNRKPGDEDLSW